MIQIKDCACGNRCEGRTDQCASCNARDRKVNRARLPEDPKPVNKISKSRQKEMQIYAQVKKQVLLNSWCAYHGKPCLPEDVHHQMGRVGFADDKEIPLLYDKRFMIPVCRQAHDWITEHSKEAIEQGYSFSRIAKPQPPQI